MLYRVGSRTGGGSLQATVQVQSIDTLLKGEVEESKILEGS